MARSAEATNLLRAAIDHRRAQRMAEATETLAKAAQLAPDDPDIAFLTAQLAYERGFPAADLFAHAQALWPDNTDILRNRALALVSEGEPEQAEALLGKALEQRPGWLDGQRVLGSLRWTAGDSARHYDGWKDGTGREPRNAGLWLGWFAAAMQHRDWSTANEALDRANEALGWLPSLANARAVLAAEAHDDQVARRAFSALEGIADDAVDLARVRFFLRIGEVKTAESAALRLLARPVSRQVWPYLSVIWRLLGDPKAQWLDGDPPFLAEVDPGFTAAELDELAKTLRALHTARRPYAEQSVRGGTQTDRSVLLRHEACFENARMKLLNAVDGFIAALPPHDPRHPLLGPSREAFGIAGSWSVRLGPGGRNVAHSHPHGWISSAFYISLPGPAEAGPPPDGYLRLGVPPAELNLDLPPLAMIAPAPGKLALFPSTMWHDTIPFTSGERLNIAFDIAPL